MFRPNFSYLSEVYESCLTRYLENPKYRGNYRLALTNTSNGRKILPSEEVDVYVALYGAHHFYKLNSAFDALDLSNFVGKNIEIFSYGCDPATETCVLIDYLMSKQINLSIKRITLIEPSHISLGRGEQYVKSTLLNPHTGVTIRTINKTLEQLNAYDVNSQSGVVKLHLFSNILDVEQVDLSSLARLIQESHIGANYFICVSPNFSSAQQRIDTFYQIINRLFLTSNISNTAQSVMGRVWLMRTGCFVERQVDRYQRICMAYTN
ncbi:MAG: hypothetical protein CLLPBCKN_005036 [Chroococcidiopsis cubana SAG 39.79]|uniref:CheR-type methyltransferase domain-containing protein n=1 Tax=Chroococcidiopsis cubana SAG 39.79 TaxID=388085 RepID=A0AB37USN4_9CYAN|nr:hypothetical protein [Chroococcidiopsis cubana]MDZ4875616.1 hypothetical protein [Chroococcidiopsis cubana SAG 39.79]PSB59610.1 hypothetical protein C7B79_28715 [Chroococcidiopsis cubana CCALA 043]RUT14408.1 hypothetical protein DSM107010_04390 [Chroococcidiopsis cubana SAG 39.79]